MPASTVSGIAWVPRGAAKSQPDRVRLEDEELKNLMQEEPTKPKTKSKNKKSTAEQVPDDADVDMQHNGLEQTDLAIIKQYGLDKYDEEEDVMGAPTMGDLMMDDDNVVNDSDDDSVVDLTVGPTDNLVCAAICDEDHQRIEVHLVEMGSYCYPHHDILLSTVPLCVEWLDFDTAGEAKDRVSHLAVGSMIPVIDIYDLDVIDPLEPVMRLGAAAVADEMDLEDATEVPTTDDAHTDAVLALSWNNVNRTVLASSSADCTVRLWDLNNASCVHIYRDHQDKVGSIAWNPAEVTVLASGAFDRKVHITDVRSKGKPGITFQASADVDTMVWNPANSHELLVSSGDGVVTCHDLRNGGESIFRLAAHNDGIPGLTMSNLVPGCLVTGSVDKTLKMWDIKGGAPKFVLEHNAAVGKVYDCRFSPDLAFVAAAGGSKGKMKIVDFYAEKPNAVKTMFGDRMEGLDQRQFEVEKRNDGEDHGGDEDEK
eukprot:Clim_evm21s44 gene=Clim_evmTU21s44